MKLIETLVARIDRASFRERVLLFAAAATLLAYLWNATLMAPLAAQQSRLAVSLEDTRQRLGKGGAAAAQDGPAERFGALKSRESALKAAIAEADLELRTAQQGMIDPKQMVSVLTDVLGHQTGLTLVLMKNLPVEPVLPPASAAGPHAPPPADLGPYVHPVELILRGSYLGVLNYLQELEAQPWGFEWRRFEFTMTDDGPEYRIEFTTLSMQPNWLGV
jgi:MSHA biogenesis protein MshJ